VQVLHDLVSEADAPRIGVVLAQGNDGRRAYLLTQGPKLRGAAGDEPSALTSECGGTGAGLADSASVEQANANPA
jgi:hypothetical protein